MLPVMFKNSWFPTVFDDFLNTDFMPRAMELAAPGIKKEYCRVSIDDDGNLCISIENKMEHKEESKKHHYLRREFSYSNYEQSYALPDDVEKDKISAKVDNGILTVVLPKVEKEEKKVAKAIEVS